MLFALLAATAFAADVQSVEIRYTERDLVEPARVEALFADIRRAARDVCDVRKARTVSERRDALACVVDAESRAATQLRRAVAEAGVIELAAR